MQDEVHSSKTETAYQLLRRDILAARLRPGASLKLGALSEVYDVGWTPLREALSRLEAEKLVTAASNRGFAVAPVSRAELEDLTKARLVIELPMLEESIAKGDSVWEEALVTAHYRLSRCRIAVDDPSEEAVDRWDENHKAFHAALLSASTSNWLHHFLTTIYDQLSRHHRVLSLGPALHAVSDLKTGYERAVRALRKAMGIEHHTLLMQAALDRDVERARMLLTEHSGYVLRFYLDSPAD